MNHWVTVDVIEVGEDPGLQLGLGGDTAMAKDRARHLGEETLDESEPRAVLGREHEAQPAFRLAIGPRLGLLGDRGRVVVEDHLDRGVGGIGGVKPLEEADELARAVAVLEVQ